MTLRVQNNSSNDFPVSSSQTSEKLTVPNTVTTTIRRNETPFSDEHFALMQAAKRAGLPPKEQKAFADANADGVMFWDKEADPSKSDDNQVRQADYKNLIGKQTIYKLSAQQVADLKNKVADFVAAGGKLHTNKEIPENPANRVNAKNGITPPSPNIVAPADALSTTFGNTPKTQFSVVLLNNGKPVTNERILAQFVEDRYRNGNLWGENFIEIAEMSAAQGAKAKNITIKPLGNKVSVYFEASVEDQLKIHENYKIVQEKVNAVEEIANNAIDKMALNQFLKGVLEGAWSSLKANWNLITSPIETAKEIIEAVKMLASLTKEDLTKIVDHLKQSGYDLIFKDDVSEVANKTGKLIGVLAVEIALGKGLGAALRGLKGIKAIESLVNKADDLAKITKLKIVGAFSDEAAQAASNRLRQRLSATQLYGGIPADALADLAIVSANKINKGVKNFAEFSQQMIREFGEAVRPQLRKLFDKSVDSIYGSRRDIELHELLGGHTIEKHVGKTEKWLRERLEAEPDIKSASSFYNWEIANRAQQKAAQLYGKEFDEWAKGNSSFPLTRTIEMGEDVGTIVTRGKGGVQVATKVEVRIVKDNTERGWHIITSFPVP